MKDMIERFELDTEDHKLQVIVEKDNHRIMKFAKRGTSCYKVTVMQTGGRICFTGDMGEFVFVNHNADMLAWFRDNISLPYIAEKCRAGDYRKYDEATAKESIVMMIDDFCEDWIEEYIEYKYRDQDLDRDSFSDAKEKAFFKAEREALFNTLKNKAVNNSDTNINFENEYTFYQSASELDIKINPSLSFNIDIGDGIPCKEYTDRFKWCVLAMNKIAFLYFNKKVSMK